MRNRKLQIAIAIIVGPIAVLGVVGALVLQDQTMLLSALLLTALYVIYLVKLISRLKKERSEKPQSPLQNRR